MLKVELQLMIIDIHLFAPKLMSFVLPSVQNQQNMFGLIWQNPQNVCFIWYKSEINS